MEKSKSSGAPSESLLPRPVPGGTGYIQSLGRWIDDLMRDKQDRRKVAEEMETRLLSEDEMPPDPAPHAGPHLATTNLRGQGFPPT